MEITNKTDNIIFSVKIKEPITIKNFFNFLNNTSNNCIIELNAPKINKKHGNITITAKLDSRNSITMTSKKVRFIKFSQKQFVGQYLTKEIAQRLNDLQNKSFIIDIKCIDGIYDMIINNSE